MIKPSLSVYIGLCLTAMVTVILELLLTRVFSASIGYHFAFMIVSMAMFGMTAGALWAFIRPPTDENALFNKLCLNSSLFAVTISLTYIAHGYVNNAMIQNPVFGWIAITYLLFSIPFFFSGTCISLCLTSFHEVGKLYAADLIGAALSCPLLIIGLTYTDPHMIVVTSAILSCLASLCFLLGTTTRKKALLASILVSLSVCMIVTCVPNSSAQLSKSFGKLELIKWSPIGRVIVADLHYPAMTWARVNTKKPLITIPQKGIWIDFGAFTVMTVGDASKEQFEPIKHDITALGNRLRPGRSLFVIGAGGGRDIITGLMYGQKHIDSLEINPVIVSLLKHKYADFNGHLANRPGVKIINDEARNWLSRSQNRYGIIQCSLVDTWSASTSGAFMLTENIIYTKEAFNLFVRHLDPDGVLSFVRWGNSTEPSQILRLLYLAKNTLNSIGVKDVGNHIMLVTAPFRASNKMGIGNMLVSPNRFNKADIDNLVRISQEEGYQLLWVPGGIAQIEPFASAITKSGIDPSMPSDNRPFFFTPVQSPKNGDSYAEPAQGKGLALLQYTFTLSSFLVLFVILFPARQATRKRTGTFFQSLKSGFFFSCLGLAFMLVEVAQLQRLTILLGNPTYGLSVVLFALLLASGIGSYTAQLLLNKTGASHKLLMIGLTGAACLVLFSAWCFAGWLPSLEAASLHQRVVSAVVLVAIPGFFMGWGFPLGMTYFTSHTPHAGAWFWALNGATSVLSSVLAAIISVIWGIEATIITGGLCYFLALLPLFWSKAHSATA